MTQTSGWAYPNRRAPNRNYGLPYLRPCVLLFLLFELLQHVDGILIVCFQLDRFLVVVDG